MPNFTKAAIKQSVIKLLNEKPLSQITVKDIVEDCGINRNSFYYHFADIPSLLEEIATEEAETIIARYPSVDSIESCLNVALDYAWVNRRAFLHIFESVNRSIYEQYLWQVCEYVITTYGKTAFRDKDIPASDKALIIRFYKSECFGLIMEWMQSGMKEDIHEDIHRLCELKKGMIEQMIERSMQN